MAEENSDKEKKDINQDDIDSLLEAAGGESEGQEKPGDKKQENPAEARETIYGGELSDEAVIKQADIDSLLEHAKTQGAGVSRPQPTGKQVKREAAPDKDNLDLLLDIGLNVRIELGRASLPLQQVLRLHEGSVVELNKLAGDPLDIVVNGRLIARGEVLVLNDNFCVRVTDVLSPEERLKAANARRKEQGS